MIRTNPEGPTPKLTPVHNQILSDLKLEVVNLKLKSSFMLARASTPRTVQRIARSFATAVDSAGVRVAAVDNNQTTSAVTVLVKAGSRYEPKPGVAHALKNFAFKVCPL